MDDHSSPGAPEAQPPAGNVEPPPAPASPPALGSAGCLRILSIGCAGFTLLVLIALGIIFLNFGSFVAKIEKDFILNATTRAGLQGSEAEVHRVLESYDQEWRKEKLEIGQWKKALTAFSRSPAALVLGILDGRSRVKVIAGMKDEEVKRAEKVLERLARATAEGKVTADDLSKLVEAARPTPGREKPRAAEVAAIEREVLARFVPEAEKLLVERGVGEGLPEIDLPALLRRDLWASLAEGKRSN
jgi:hypothetical protein